MQHESIILPSTQADFVSKVMTFADRQLGRMSYVNGLRMQNSPYPRVAGQDPKHFALGTSARPAAGYWAAVAGLSNDKQIEDAIAELSDAQEIEDTLVKLLGSHRAAQDYMKWRKKDSK